MSMQEELRRADMEATARFKGGRGVDGGGSPMGKMGRRISHNERLRRMEQQRQASGGLGSAARRKPLLVIFNAGCASGHAMIAALGRLMETDGKPFELRVVVEPSQLSRMGEVAHLIDDLAPAAEDSSQFERLAGGAHVVIFIPFFAKVDRVETCKAWMDAAAVQGAGHAILMSQSGAETEATLLHRQARGMERHLQQLSFRNGTTTLRCATLMENFLGLKDAIVQMGTLFGCYGSSTFAHVALQDVAQVVLSLVSELLFRNREFSPPASRDGSLQHVLKGNGNIFSSPRSPESSFDHFESAAGRGSRDGRDGSPELPGSRKRRTIRKSRTYHITGPVPMAGEEYALILSQQLNIDVMYKDVNPAELRRVLVHYGWPAWLAREQVDLFVSHEQYEDMEIASPHVKSITGRHTKFETWARASAPEFRGGIGLPDSPLVVILTANSETGLGAARSLERDARHPPSTPAAIPIPAGVGPSNNLGSAETVHASAPVRIRLALDAPLSVVKARKIPGMDDVISGVSLSNPDSTRNALQDADRLLLIPSFEDMNASSNCRRIIDIAIQSGVSHICLISQALPTGSVLPRWNEVMLEIEQHLKQKKHTEVTWVVLRVSFLMDRFLGSLGCIKRMGKLIGCHGAGAFPAVCAQDVGRAAAVALTDMQYAGGTLCITGPEALTGDDYCAIICEVTGLNVQYRDQPPTTFEATLGMSSWPRWQAASLTELMDAYRNGLAEEVCLDTLRMTGRHTTFKEFVFEHLDFFLTDQ